MKGHPIRLSLARRLAIDHLRFAKRVPTVPVQRRMRLGAVIDARRECSQRPSWTAIFVKAFSQVCVEMPELRRAYVAFPYVHLYEYDSITACVAIERDLDGENAVLMGRLKDPDTAGLIQLSESLQRFREAPIAEIKEFKRSLRLAGLPGFVRRIAWWLALNRPSMRARYFGTFAVSVYSALGAESLHPISPLTTLLNYGVFDARGNVDVRLIYDHRVMDGATIARALARLEDVLRYDLVAELRDLSSMNVTVVGDAQAGWTTTLAG